MLDYVVNIMRANAFVDHSDEINSPYAMVPIIVYCFDKNGVHLTDVEIRKMVKWFFYSQIKARYVSQLPQKLDRDLRAVAKEAQPFDSLLQVIAEEGRLEILPGEFEGRAIQHPLFSMMRWYFKSRGAVCFTTGMTLRKNMGSKYQLERDHIFPFSKLRDAGYDQSNRVKYALAQELTNRAILTQVENRTKSNMLAADYLASAKKKFPKALELQCVPENVELWKLENYEQFLVERRKVLAKHLNAFLEKITATEETVAPASVEDLIADGESDGLEFKSTLRWDLVESTINKRLEDVVIKTIAAFANSQGGTLLIGVADDGNLLGLESDYHSLGDGDRDKFEIHLRNLLNQQFGVGFVTGKIAVKFHVIGDLEICQIDTAPAIKPMILTAKDKNGQAVEKFYARSGNSSQEFSLSEMSAYIKERFHS